MIEFIENEEYCRWNGVLMSPENHKKLIGIEEELRVCGPGLIGHDGIYYTDLDLGQMLSKIGIVEKEDGWRNPSRVIVRSDSVFDWRIKPYDDFMKDYPDFKKDVYIEFYDELDKFYAKMLNGGSEIL